MTELTTLLHKFLSSANTPDTLFTATDWDALVGMWQDSEVDISRRLVVEWRMSIVLLEVDDMDTLINRRMRAPSAFVQTLIEQRMARTLHVLLQTVDDWNSLVKFKMHTQEGSVAQQLIARRMRQILPNILPHTSDWTALFKMWKAVPRGSRAEQLIEARMIAMIFAITPDAVPEWFVYYLRQPESIPNQHLAIHFCEKARTLLLELDNL